MREYILKESYAFIVDDYAQTNIQILWPLRISTVEILTKQIRKILVFFYIYIECELICIFINMNTCGVIIFYLTRLHPFQADNKFKELLQPLNVIFRRSNIHQKLPNCSQTVILGRAMYLKLGLYNLNFIAFLFKHKQIDGSALYQITNLPTQ